MWKGLYIFPPAFFTLVFRQFNTFSIPIFYNHILSIILTLIFKVLEVIIFKTYICIIGIFTYFFINVSIIFLSTIFRIFYFFKLGRLAFLAVVLFLSSFVNVLHVFICLTLILATIIHHQVLFLFMFMIDNDSDCLQSNNDTSSNDLWLLFTLSFLFLKV